MQFLMVFIIPCLFSSEVLIIKPHRKNDLVTRGFKLFPSNLKVTKFYLEGRCDVRNVIQRLA